MDVRGGRYHSDDMDVSHVADALVVAVEPDPDQASTIASIVRERVRAELVIGDSARAVLAALDARAPDLILTSPLLPPGDEALIADRLRQLGARATHVQMLTIPLLAAHEQTSRESGLLSLLRRKPSGTHVSGCAPETFAKQVRSYLDQASVERERHGAPAGPACEVDPDDPHVAMTPTVRLLTAGRS